MGKSQKWLKDWDKGGRLGKGGQGLTFLARRKGETDYNYVLKELRPSHQADPDRRARMYREVAALNALKHPNVVRYVDSNADKFDSSDPLFLVTELIKGGHPTGPIDWQEALEIVTALLETLEWCHERNYIHRDIKPDNIILRGQNCTDPVLLDFGLSFNEEARPNDFSTETSERVGPYNFLALPEQSGGSRNKRSEITDVTQCAGLLFHLITGDCPYLLLNEKNQKPHQRPEAQNRLAEIPMLKLRAFTRLFDIGFENDPADRWSSAAKLKIEIRRISGLAREEKPPKLQEQLSDLLGAHQRSGEHRRREKLDHLLNYTRNCLTTNLATARRTVNELAPNVLSCERTPPFGPPNAARLREKYDFADPRDKALRIALTVSAYRDANDFVVTQHHARKQSRSVFAPGSSFVSPAQDKADPGPPTSKELLRVPLSDETAEERIGQYLRALVRDVVKEYLELREKSLDT